MHEKKKKKKIFMMMKNEKKNDRVKEFLSKHISHKFED